MASAQSWPSSTSGPAHLASRRWAQFRPRPLTPSSHKLQDSPLAKTLPQINPIPNRNPASNPYIISPVPPHSPLWTGNGDTWEVPGDRGIWTRPLYQGAPPLPGPLAPPLVLPLLTSIIGSLPWLCHWLYSCLAAAPPPNFPQGCYLPSPSLAPPPDSCWPVTGPLSPSAQRHS